MSVSLTPADAFLLGYLRDRIGAHFSSFDILVKAGENAKGELAKRIQEGISALPARGPEIVSCVRKIEDILNRKLGSTPPHPPGSYDEYLAWVASVGDAFGSAARSAELQFAFDLGGRCGLAEQIVAITSLQRHLWAADPQNEWLAVKARRLPDSLLSLAAKPHDGPDKNVSETIETEMARELRAAAALVKRPAEDDVSGEFAPIQFRIGHLARAAESAVRGSARDSILAWSEKRMDGVELMRRLAEHYLWNVPCRFTEGQAAPRIFTFDKNVLFAFSDSQSSTNRPAFLKSENADDQLFLTLVGTGIFRWLPNENVDLLVIDATDDPNAPLTINYPKEMHARLRQVGEETAAELAACDWSKVDRATLRAHQFWILVAGSSVRNIVLPDGRGRRLAGLFTSEIALNATLKTLPPELAAEFANCQQMLLAGESLFPSLAHLDLNGFIVNPNGPGRSRAFNMKMMEMLAEG